MSEDVLLEAETGGMLAQAGNQAIAAWSDDKKREFVGTFNQRTQAARYILETTAYHIAQTAMRRKFMSALHLRKLFPDSYDTYSGDELFQGWMARGGQRMVDNPGAPWGQPRTVGGREAADLFEIAAQRAMLVIEELPALRAAVQIIDPATAAKIDRKEKLLIAGQQLTEELDGLNEQVSLEELDQKMTIGAFRKFIKDRDLKRKQIVGKLEEIGKEGSMLEDAINKTLYKGLPGLTDAIMDAIRGHLDRSKALDEMSRRVGERVMFGDSKEALELLAMFEKDEAALPDTIKSSIRDALRVLKLDGKKRLQNRKIRESVRGKKK